MADVKKGFRTPAEVTGYFEGKNLRPGFSWLDVWGQEHAHAFTVAKAVDLELLTTFKRSIGAAIAGGESFETWRAKIQDDLTALGWWGPKRVEDPELRDVGRVVDFSSRRRLETIFWSNMRSARAAGQWERAQRTKRALPYLLYVRSSSAEPRAEHLAWAGIILAVDDPWWRTHFPPNGWGCKCSVRQMTGRERDKLLATTPDPDDEKAIRYRAEPIEDGPPRQFRNRRTGEVTEVPAGIDPGWHTNPGLSRSETLIDNLAGKLEAAAPADAAPIVEEMWADAFLRLSPKLPEKAWLPAGVSPRLQADLGAVGPIVGIDNAAIAERIVRHGSTIDDFAKLPGILSEGAVLPNLRPSGEIETDARTLVKRIGKTWWRAIVVKSRTGRMRVRSLHQRAIRDVALQILDSGLGRDGLIAAAFTDEEADRLFAEWKRRRGEGNNPVG